MLRIVLLFGSVGCAEHTYLLVVVWFFAFGAFLDLLGDGVLRL